MLAEAPREEYHGRKRSRKARMVVLSSLFWHGRVRVQEEDSMSSRLCLPQPPSTHAKVC
jgi:hypothetical protein